jgi:hypothetical protein
MKALKQLSNTRLILGGLLEHLEDTLMTALIEESMDEDKRQILQSILSKAKESQVILGDFNNEGGMIYG